MELTIRQALPEDWKIIQKLNHEVFQDNGAYDVHMHVDWPLSKDGETYYKEVLQKKDHVCFIAEKEKTAVGYIVGGPKDFGYRTVKTAEVQNMGVSPAYRSQNVGTKLVDHFKNWAKSQGYQTLYVISYESNHRAVNFYKNQGFKPIDLSLEMTLD